VCIGLALLELWSGRYQLQADGVSYLDMSDAFLRHNWGILINPYWSPLYPFLVGVATWLIRPSANWELPVMHAVNFAIFIGALASFEFFLREVIRVCGQEGGQEDSLSALPLPAWMWQVLGYCLFAWSTIVLNSGLFEVTPDLLVAAFVYLDAGLVLRLRSGANPSRTSLLLGLTLGLGYFAKAILFPVAFVFMAVAFLVAGGWREAIRALALTFLIFGAIAAPLFLGISKMLGRPSFGESGKLNYAWYVDGEDSLRFYSTSPPPYLTHPLSRVHREPNVFEFGQPFRATYPLLFNPSYWNDGVKVQMNMKGQLRVIAHGLVVFYLYLVERMWGLIGGFLILFFMSPNLPRRLKDILKGWPLLVCGAAAPCLYVFVHVEPRFLSAFVVLVWLGLFSGIRLQKSQDSIKLGAIATLVIATSMMIFTARYVVYHLVDPFPHLRGHGGEYYQVAESLDGKGLRAGETVAIIGKAERAMLWARLARVRIVAQISPDDADEFWLADPRVKAEVLKAMAGTGAKAVVTEMTPPSDGSSDWQSVGNTKYFVHFLGWWKN
jgi:hypothetical protein